MIETISPSYLLAIGILLIGLEALTFSFVLFFVGIGFVVVSGISMFYEFDNGMIQIAVASVIALVSALSLRGYMLEKLSSPSEVKEKKTHISGVGFVEDGTIKFDGTYWKTLSDISSYKDGDQVDIVEVVDNMVVLETSQSEESSL